MFGKKRKPQPMPPWLKWGLIVFVGLAFASQGLHPNKSLHWGLPSMETYKAQILPNPGSAACGPQAAPKNSMGLRVFEVRSNLGKQVACGDTVNAQLVIWDMRGAKLLETQMPLTPGSGKDMAGLEQGIAGMHMGSARTLLIPPALQKPLSKDGALANLQLPDNQTIIVDVELLP